MNTRKVRVYLWTKRGEMLIWIFLALVVRYYTWEILSKFYLTYGSPKVVKFSIVGSFLFMFLLLWLVYWALGVVAKKSQKKYSGSYEKIKGATERLCERTGRPVPVIGLWKGVFFDRSLKSVLSGTSKEKILAKLLALNAGMVDIPFKRDVMFVGERLPEVLSDEQLEAVIAHELRHSNQPENKLKYLPMFFGAAISWLLFFGGWHFLFAAGFFRPSTWGMLMLASLLVKLANWLIKFPLAAFSRTCEHETDVEACCDISDPEHLISGLETIMAEMENELREAAEASGKRKKKTWSPLRSHPTNKQRARVLRRLAA